MLIYRFINLNEHTVKRPVCIAHHTALHTMSVLAHQMYVFSQTSIISHLRKKVCLNNVITIKEGDI